MNILVDERHYFHVVFAPILVHVFNLNLDYLRCILSYLWVFELADESLHYQLYALRTLEVLPLLCIRQGSP